MRDGATGTGSYHPHAGYSQIFRGISDQACWGEESKTEGRAAFYELTSLHGIWNESRGISSWFKDGIGFWWSGGLGLRLRMLDFGRLPVSGWESEGKILSLIIGSSIRAL